MFTNVNEAPSIAAQTFTISSKSLLNAPVGRVTATDVDAGQSLSYAITGGNNGAFAINTTTGAIRVADATKLPVLGKGVASADVNLIVSVTDSATPALTSSATVKVTVSATGRNAPIVNTTTLSINENNKSGAKIGAVVPVASYAGQKFGSFAISGADAANFAIDPAKGMITVKPGVTLNKEAKASYAFQVTVADSVATTLTSTSTVTINIGDLNEAPVISVAASGIGALTTPLTKGVATITIDENTPTSVAINDAIIGSLTAADPDNVDADTLQILAYSLVGGTPVAGSPTKKHRQVWRFRV